MTVNITTYIYLNDKGRCVHSNCGMGAIGKEYEHNDINWQPPTDWPYKVEDLRKANGE